MMRTENREAWAALRAWLKGKNIRKLCRLTGISKSTVYSWLEEERPIPAWAPALIHRVYPDLYHLRRVLGFDVAGLMVVTEAQAAGVDGLLAQALKVGAAAGKLEHDTVRAAADGVIDEREAQQLEQDKEALEREAEGHGAAVRQLRRRRA